MHQLASCACCHACTDQPHVPGLEERHDFHCFVMEKIMTETKKRDATKKYVQFSQAGGAKLMNGHLVDVATLAEVEESLRNPNEWKKWGGLVQ